MELVISLGRNVGYWFGDRVVEASARLLLHRWTTNLVTVRETDTERTNRGSTSGSIIRSRIKPEGVHAWASRGSKPTVGNRHRYCLLFVVSSINAIARARDARVQ